MAKTTTRVTSTDQQKQNKKQAQLEAKLMLRIEQAKKDLRKAEKKAAKAQAQLEETRGYLSSLEEKHAQMQAPVEAQTTPNGVIAKEMVVTLEPLEITGADSEARPDDDIEEMHHTSLPPVEGRPDISQVNESTSSKQEEKHDKGEGEKEGATDQATTSEDDSSEEEAEKQSTSTRRRKRRSHTSDEENKTDDQQ
jgi:hypothetical protein